LKNLMKTVSKNLPGFMKSTASIHRQNVIDYLMDGTLNRKGMDTDDDYLDDFTEGSANANTNTLAWHPDSDVDGLKDGVEYYGWLTTAGDAVGTKYTSFPNVKDTDGDGLWDDDEKAHNTNPRCSDTDGDGLSDYQEIDGTYYYHAFGIESNIERMFNYPTDPAKWDTDGDGINDGLEIQFYMNPQQRWQDTAKNVIDITVDQIVNQYPLRPERPGGGFNPDYNPIGPEPDPTTPNQPREPIMPPQGSIVGPVGKGTISWNDVSIYGIYSSDIFERSFYFDFNRGLTTSRVPLAGYGV